MIADDSHLTPDQVTSYLGRSLPPEERARIALHLDTCGECRDELIEVGSTAADYRTLIHPPAALRLRRLLMPVAIAAAASLAAIAVYRGRTPTHDSVVRATDSPRADESAPAIEVVGPEDGARMADSVVLRWRSVGQGSYQVFLLSEDGRPVWTAQTTDTVVRVPSAIVLPPGATYFWRVDAMANGIVASTGVRRLTVP